MGKNLYDESFEKRIRIKYFMLGATLSLSFVGLLGLIGITSQIVISIIMDIPLEIKGNVHMMYAPFALFIPLAYFMWFSKAKPIKHPDKEIIGLKDDWDKVR